MKALGIYGCSLSDIEVIYSIILTVVASTTGPNVKYFPVENAGRLKPKGDKVAVQDSDRVA